MKMITCNYFAGQLKSQALNEMGNGVLFKEDHGYGIALALILGQHPLLIYLKLHINLSRSPFI